MDRPLSAKAKAVIEGVVVFGLTLFLFVLVGLSSIGRWERRVLNGAYIEYAAWGRPFCFYGVNWG
jgi:hypothetical protein